VAALLRLSRSRLFDRTQPIISVTAWLAAVPINGGAGFVRPFEFVRLGPAQHVVEFHPSLDRAGDGESDHDEPQTVFGPRRVIAGEVEAIPLAPSNAVERRAARAVNPYLFESQPPDTRQSHYNIAMKILERLKSGGATAQQAVAKSGESLA
jgi:hypothetical protein